MATAATAPAPASAQSSTRRAVRPAPRFALASLTKQNVGTLRRLNGVLFPVNYSDKVYKEVLAEDLEDFCKLAYYNDVAVGTVCCRIEPGQNPGEPARLYIMTMGVLAPYRRQGLASFMLEHVLSSAVSSSPSLLPGEAPTPRAPISSAYLHVQKGNDDAKAFYESQGFVQVGEVEEYYRKVEPRGAWVLEKKLGA